jgi:hypothetical protein
LLFDDNLLVISSAVAPPLTVVSVIFDQADDTKGSLSFAGGIKVKFTLIGCLDGAHKTCDSIQKDERPEKNRGACL